MKEEIEDDNTKEILILQTVHYSQSVLSSTAIQWVGFKMLCAHKDLSIREFTGKDKNIMNLLFYGLK